VKRQLIIGIALVAVGIAVWAVRLLFSKPEQRKLPSQREPWEESLEVTMKSKGTPETYVIANATHTIALCLANLTAEVEKFSASTERLGKVNLLLVFVVAVATIASPWRCGSKSTRLREAQETARCPVSPVMKDFQNRPIEDRMPLDDHTLTFWGTQDSPLVRPERKYRLAPR
jgi:hypothetical protein